MATYYISPSGNDGNSGTLVSPWYTLARAWQVLAPGDILYLRGGTYAYTSQAQCYCVGVNGTPSQRIRVENYVNAGVPEVPIFTKGSGYQNNVSHWRGGVFFSGDYFDWKGIDFTNFKHGTDPITGFIWRGLYVENSNFCTFKRLNSYSNEHGISLQGNSRGNLFENCDAYFNWDIGTGGGNADGMGANYIEVNDAANPNVFRYCRSWWNGDDGFDAWTGSEAGGYVEWDTCWAWHNGYYPGTFNNAGNGEGFKAGGGGSNQPTIFTRTYKNCLAYRNRHDGFNQNNLNSRVRVYNCTAFFNERGGIDFSQNNTANELRNNISYNNEQVQLYISAESVSSNNSYAGTGGLAGPGAGNGGWTNNVSDADFVDVVQGNAHVQLSAARGPNGELPSISFLHLASGSDMIDTGTNVGIPFTGSAPDRGAFEFNSGGNFSPSANAGADQVITLPTDNVTLVGSASDIDGTITTYTWTKTSGGAATIVSPSSSTTVVDDLVEGSYVFRLTVTDNGGATNFDEVNVTVNSVGSQIYYVAPTGGSDSNPGTLAQPWATLEFAASQLSAGDILYLRGGTYRSAKAASVAERFQMNGMTGTSSNKIYVWNYPGEVPILNMDDVLCTASTVWGFYLTNSAYVHIKGLKITGLAQNPSGNSIIGIQVDGSDNCTVENCEIYNIGGYGCYNFNSDNTLWKNVDAHHCDDRYTGWTNANGFNITGGDSSTNITFENCRAWWCSDDGFDFFGVDGTFTLRGCWSFWNGYEPGTFTPRGDGFGFKLGPHATDQSAGPIRRYVHNCAAFENLEGGFTQNSGRMKYQLYNNTSYDNGLYGFTWIWHTDVPQDAKNNLAYLNNTNQDGNPIIGTFNSWNGAVVVTAADFQSLVSTGVDGARDSNGNLPVLSYLKLAPGSDLIDAGTDVSLGYYGNNPDMGAFEFNPTGNNLNPTANAGVDQTITLPTNQVTLSGSGNDVDGTIVAYQWSKMSGTGGVIVSPSSGTTQVTGLMTGVYVFRLTVTDDDGAIGYDEVMVTVNPDPNTLPQELGGISHKTLLRLSVISQSADITNIAPTADAGSDQSIGLPTNSVNLVGSGNDVDGTIASYLWVKISGGTANIVSPTSASTLVTGLEEGTYIFRLTVTDDDGAIGSDDITVTVNSLVANLQCLNFTVVDNLLNDSDDWTSIDGQEGRGATTAILPAATDGSIQAEYTGTINENGFISFDDASGTENYADSLYTMYVDPSTQTFQLVYQAYGETQDTGIQAQFGDLYRLSRNGTTGAVTGAYYRAGVWTDVFTFTATTTAALYFKCSVLDSITPLILKDVQGRGIAGDATLKKIEFDVTDNLRKINSCSWNSADGFEAQGASAVTIPDGVETYIQAQFTDGNNEEVFVCLDDDAAADNYADTLFWLNVATSGFYDMGTEAYGETFTSGVAAQTGDLYRLHKAPDGTVTAQYFRSNVWNDLYEFTATHTATVYFKINILNGATLKAESVRALITQPTEQCLDLTSVDNLESNTPCTWTSIDGFEGRGVASKTVPSGIETYIIADWDNSLNYNAFVSMDSANTVQNHADNLYTCYVDPGSTNFECIYEGYGESQNSTIPAQAGDKYGLFRASDGTVTARYYRNNIWTTFFTFTTPYSGILYLKGSVLEDVGRNIKNLKALVL